MADETKPRAVSGEIMTAPDKASPARIEPSADAIDADYISLPAGSLSAAKNPSDSEAVSRPRSQMDAPQIGMDMLRRKQGGSETPSGGPLFWSAGVALVIAAFWISGGHALVRNLPLFAVHAPQSSLRISAVTSRVDASGANTLLLVDGVAVNEGTDTEHVQALEIAVTGNDGRITRYRLGTSGRPLAPGETFAFSSRLDAPKSGVKIVSVTFTE